MYKVLLLFIFIFTGCSYKTPYLSSKPYYVVIKNPQIAIADTGFVKRDNTRLNLQLFSASTPIFDLHVKDDICLDYVCMKKENFNKEFFGFSHYEDFINELFNFNPIYDRKNFKKTKTGFEQNIKSDKFNITYKIEGKNLYFKDKQNRILIKLKELK